MSNPDPRQDGYPEDDSAAQHQDQLEKEERLVSLLRSMLWQCQVTGAISNFKVEDVDFVASALGLSNYRK